MSSILWVMRGSRKLSILLNITMRQVAVVRAVCGVPRVPYLEGVPTFVFGAHAAPSVPTL